MKCFTCQAELHPREHAQPFHFQGHRFWPKSLCDPCARANQYRPGSPTALDRLATGVIDPTEKAKVAAATTDWARTTELTPIDYRLAALTLIEPDKGDLDPGGGQPL